MGKYWAKIEEAVEGPFEGVYLKFLDGFNANTLVSPDEPECGDTWTKAQDLEELREVLFPPPKPPEEKKPEIEAATPTVLVEPERQPEGATLPHPEKLEEEIYQDNAQTVETPQAVPENELVEEVPEETRVPQEPETKAPNTFPFAEDSPDSLLTSDPSSQAELLEVMEKFSQHFGKKAEKETPIEDPLGIIHLNGEFHSPSHSRTEEVRAAKSALVKRLKKAVVILSVMALLLGIGYMATKTQTFNHLKEYVKSKFSEDKKPPVKEEVKEPPEVKPPVKKVKKKPKPRVRKPRKAVSKPKPKPKPVATAPAPKPEDLKNQKYLLPGVPSPNVTTKIEEGKQEEGEKKTEDKPSKEESKKKKAEKQFENIEWMNQSSWGQ